MDTDFLMTKYGLSHEDATYVLTSIEQFDAPEYEVLGPQDWDAIFTGVTEEFAQGKRTGARLAMLLRTFADLLVGVKSPA